MDPDFPALAAAFSAALLPASSYHSQPSTRLLSLLSSGLRARVQAAGDDWARSLVTAQLYSAELADALAARLHLVYTNGVRRVSAQSLHASAVFCGSEDYELADEEQYFRGEIEVRWTYNTASSASSSDSRWLVDEVRFADADDALYWRPWCVTVAEAERSWQSYLDSRDESKRIRSALLQLRSEAVAAAKRKSQYCDATQSMYHSWRNTEDLTPPLYAEETDTVTDDDEEGSYWSQYDAPSKNFLHSLSAIRRLTSLDYEADYSSSSSAMTSAGSLATEKASSSSKPRSFLPLLPKHDDGNAIALPLYY
ncbi:uncharacterized protein V2V93DRAFT_365951 [Kockiozyma suomiensis]|uniref:uncharacterized protein n=1 Tax=Kockiozyma suomiensis TaxID=1337062 RepID=UPI0033437F6A